jgi:hypothetical protein
MVPPRHASQRIATHRNAPRKDKLMKTATCSLIAISPYSQSRAHETPKNDRETADAFEQRTWREKCHTTPSGNVFIPPMAFKQAIDAAAKMLGMQIPGKGKSTYTKYFLSGVLCTEGIVLPETKDTVADDRIHCNADGVRGSGKRVWRRFPRIDTWRGDLPVVILANEITKEVFEETLRQAGSFVGIGRFRPQSGGFYGRFSVERIRWE